MTVRRDGDALPGKWLRLTSSYVRPRMRLICFPHAGGSASFFHAWVAYLPDGVELAAVRYPGREDRIREPLAETMDELAGPLAEVCAAYADAPLALFGHSMGASVAYEVALRLEREHGTVPAALFVSSRNAPGHVREREPASDDDALVRELMELGGTAAAALHEPELRELVLPIVRADYRLLERYEPQASTTALAAPIVAYRGVKDPGVSEAAMAAWARMTTTRFSGNAMPGGHFYFQDDPGTLVRDIGLRLGLPA